MSNIKEILHKDDQILKVLAPHNVDRINRLICNTNQGALELEIRKGEKDYHMVLGAVPLSKEESKELMDLLFSMQKLEVPQVNKLILSEKQQKDISEGKAITVPVSSSVNVPKPKKKLGRPKGSKDGRSDME